jgi:hypothetical protein
VAAGVRVAVGVAVGLALGVMVGVALGVAVGVEVGVGVAADCAQYLPPVFKWRWSVSLYPPQTIISLPVQTPV